MAIARRGMWVTVKGRVGIVDKLEVPIYEWFLDASRPEGEQDSRRQIGVGVEVHYVDDKGETVGTETVEYGRVSQAAYLDIPEARRPTEEVARGFGYL